MKFTTLAPNQNVAETTEGKFFISYDTKICFIPNDGSPIQLDRKN